MWTSLVDCPLSRRQDSTNRDPPRCVRTKLGLQRMFYNTDTGECLHIIISALRCPTAEHRPLSLYLIWGLAIPDFIIFRFIQVLSRETTFSFTLCQWCIRIIVKVNIYVGLNRGIFLDTYSDKQSCL